MQFFFLSDLHLSSNNQLQNQKFINWLQQFSSHKAEIYILGDLFDAWCGFELTEAWCQDIISTLANFTKKYKVNIMLGNHDFLLNARFEKLTGCKILYQDEVLVEIASEPTLLMHGDTLATDDINYQKFRHIIRHPITKACYQLLPRKFKEKLKVKIQAASEKTKKTNHNMHLTSNGVRQHHSRYPIAKQLICGHFHTASTQQYTTPQGNLLVRVLPAWTGPSDTLVLS